MLQGNPLRETKVSPHAPSFVGKPRFPLRPLPSSVNAITSTDSILHLFLIRDGVVGETVGFPTRFPYKIDRLFYPGIKNIFLSLELF
jgi:hypothetical protein